jgi:hypothetical protein
MYNFLTSAASRETSYEILEAILFVAGQNEAAAKRIWEDPDQVEGLAIWERVTGNGLRAATEYTWGASGTQWAETLGIVKPAETEKWEAWIDGKRDEAAQFEVSPGEDVVAAGASALNVAVNEELNVARVGGAQ